MPELAFVLSSGQEWFLREFVETLRYELEQQDVPSTLHTDGFPEPAPDQVYVLVAPEEYVADEEGRLPDAALLQRTIFLCAHAALDDELQDLGMLRRAGRVFDIDLRSVARLRRAGIPARHLRPGYSPVRDRFDPDADRALDVMFLGARSGHRTMQLSRCAAVLASHNCLIQLADDSQPNFAGSSSFLAGEKWDLLARTRIMLNIHRDVDPRFEWLRVLDAIHAGAVVVTEHSLGMAPLVAGEHLLSCTPESLPFVLEAALRDDELVQRLRRQAYERIRSWLPLALSVSVFRAAAVELVGRPIPSRASLGSRLTPAGPHTWTPTRAYGDRETQALRRRLRDVTADVIEVRRQLARLEQVVRSGNGSAPSDAVIDETPVWQARPDPIVTVIITAHNHAGGICGTLESLARTRFGAFEVVVVDDASTDNSIEAVREWMGRRPRIATRLVAHSAGRGLAAARNTAIGFARGPYCLILDGGNEVYKRALDVLVPTLDATTEAVLAYPIVQVFGTTDAFIRAGGDYLVNVFGWEPGRLRLWQPVDSIALIRTAKLRELDGFATDPQLEGWEDYDLWCRIAERGWRGQLVPQILGRRKVSPTIVAQLTEPCGTATMSAMLERAPRVLASVVPTD